MPEAQGEVAPPRRTWDAVRVTSVDYNPALPLPKMFDGSPFSAIPDWLDEAVAVGRIMPHNMGSTDYAQWLVLHGETATNARPGDWIIAECGKPVAVVRSEYARAILERAQR